MMAHRYGGPIDLDADDAHARVIRLVGERKHVLELGCATGYMSQVLVERLGCRVTGVERDAEAAEEARKACSQVVAGDAETLDLTRELGDDRFDVAVCADFLEHLRDPVTLLRAVRGLLAPGGYVVASIPNVAHAAVLAELLQGRFPYRPTGLLDETHLRFFTRESIYDCFERAGFVVSHLERVLVEPEDTEFATDPSRLPAALWQALRARDESTTYQFVLTAHPAAERRGTAVLDDARRELVAARPAGRPDPTAGDETAWWRRRVEALLDAMLARLRFLEDDRDRRGAELEALRARITYHEMHGQLLQDDISRREAQAGVLREEIAARQAQLDLFREHSRQLEAQLDLFREHSRQLEAQLDLFREHSRQLEAQLDLFREHSRQLEAQLADLKSGIGWRALECFRRLRAGVLPPGSRRERAYLRLLRIGAPRRPPS